MTDTTAEAGTERLSAAQRREALLDVALQLLGDGGESAISIGSVAERAEVTRALVYKHFENRDDVIIQLQRREAERLDHEVVAVVDAAPGGFEPKLRAMVEALLSASHRWDTVFSPLRNTAAGPIGRREQRRRDRRTVRYFGRLAADDYGIPVADATRAVSLTFGGIDPLIAMVRPNSSDERRRELGELYVSLTVDALRALGERCD